MRPRSKSLFIESRIEDNEDLEAEEDSSVWKIGDDARLIHLIREQIPRDDNLPYNERLDKIKWDKIFIHGRSSIEIRERFESIFKKCRTFRLLSEILRDIGNDFLTTIEPKKPKSSFLIFFEKNKDMIKEKLKVGDNFLQTASKLFNELPDEEKEIYKKESSKIRKEYKNIICKYNLDFKANKNLDRKTTPLSILWEHKKQRNPNVTYSDVRKQYSKFDKDHKLKWILKWLDVKTGEKLNTEQYKLAKSSLSREEMTIIDDYEGRPKKLTAYTNYLKDYIAMHRDDNIPHSVLFKRVSEEWRNLSPKDKTTYDELSKRIKQTYDEEFKEFIESLPNDRQEYELQKLKSPRKKGKQNSENPTNTNLDIESVDSNIKRKQKKKLTKLSDEDKSNDDFVQLQQQKKKKVQKQAENEDKNVVMTNGTKVRDTKKNKTQKQAVEKQSTITEKTIKRTKSKKQSENKESTQIGILSPDRLKEGQNYVSSNNEQDSDDENENAPVKKRKISKENSLQKKNNSESDASASNMNKRKVNKTQKTHEDIMKRLIKPPSSVYKYYVLNIYKGPMDKAKNAFKSLSTNRKNTIRKKYEGISAKFLNDFKAYAQTLTPNELAEFSEMYRKSEDDQISDLTDSEEESD